MKNKHEEILKWLNEHDLIAIGRLEAKLNLPYKHLANFKLGRKLDEKFVPAIEEELKKYGYVSIL